MNDIEKAIEYFIKRMERGMINNDTEQEVYETAISALEKQMLKKPVLHEETEEDYKRDTCPRCGEYLSISVTLYEYKYCFDCGQKLDWNVEDE